MNTPKTIMGATARALVMVPGGGKPPDMVDNVHIMAKQVVKVNRCATADVMSDSAGADVGEKLHALVHRLRRHHQQVLSSQPDAAAPMEWRVLGFFARRPGACARDLVEHSGRDKAQVARLIRLLIDRGYLEGAQAPQDQRIQQLRLTAAGQQEARRMRALRQRIDKRMLAALNAEEKLQICELLDRLYTALGEP